MIDIVPVTKDEDQEQPIPSAWRKTLGDIVESFVDGDYTLQRGIRCVPAISASDAHRIGRNIEEYGERLVNLPVEAWNTSTCQWQIDYWDVFVDLFTEQGASDLVLFTRVFEDHDQEDGYRFVVISVHVP